MMNRPLRPALVCLIALIVLAGCSPDEARNSSSDSTLDSASPQATAALPASLQIDDLDAFLDEASRLLVLRSPETITRLGLGDALGVGDSALSPLSQDYREATQALEAAVVGRLSEFDLQAASETTRLNAETYGGYLVGAVDGHRFADHRYLVHPGITSYPQTLERFMTATHPIRTEQNALDYLARLSQFEERYDELLAALARSETVHAVPPQFLVQHIHGTLRRMASLSPDASPLYT